jgi:hypothetical protein
VKSLIDDNVTAEGSTKVPELQAPARRASTASTFIFGIIISAQAAADVVLLIPSGPVQ